VADPLVDEVLDLLRTDRHLRRLVTVVHQLDDKQRKALSGRVVKRAEGMWFGEKDGRNAAVLAVLGCATGVRQAASALEYLPVDEEAEPLAVEVLAGRRPHWLPSLPEALLVGRERGPYGFRLIRALVRAGLVDRPQFPEYVLSMARGLVQDWSDGPSVLDCLRADAGLLDDEIWQLFHTEGAGKELTPHDGWFLKPYQQWEKPVAPRPERTWQHALVTLAREGMIERSRLIDETLGAFFRDWTPGDVAWFVKLHDALDPTLDELSARQQTYGRLLAVQLGPAVNLGLRMLGVLLAAGRLDVAVVVSNAPAVLARSDKGPVVEALKLLDRAARARPDLADQVAEVAGAGLDHDRVEIRERATALVAKHVPDPGGRELLAARHSQGVLGAPMAAPTPAPVAEPPAPIPLEAVADADELAELLARLVEEADDPAEVERLLEGVLRFARVRPKHGVDALIKRLDVLLKTYYPGPWFGEELRADLVQLGLVWLDHREPGAGHRGRGFDAISHRRPDWSLATLVTCRIREVTVAVAAGGRPLLSFPSYRDGSLETEALSVRVAALGRVEKPLPFDAGLAALRVPPGGLDALQLPNAHRTAKLIGAQVELLRRHRSDWELVIGDSKHRYTGDLYNNAVTWRDRAAPDGDPNCLAAAVLHRRDPLPDLALEANDGDYASRFEQVTGLWPLMLPHHVDLLAAHAHARLTRGLEKNRAASEPLLEAIGRSRQPVGGPAASALVLGLAAKNGVERTRAVDAVIDLSGRGLLDGGLLGAQLGALLQADAVVGSRIAPGLADAARADIAAAGTVLDCLAAVLTALPGRRDAHLYVDLLAELASQQGRVFDLPAPFIELSRSRQRSMLAKACRRVPADTQGSVGTRHNG
jgi:hypothetical protein